jgi:hypothetical protein
MLLEQVEVNIDSLLLWPHDLRETYESLIDEQGTCAIGRHIIPVNAIVFGLPRNRKFL